MKITFLIGNGFDLNLGLRTTYKAFYKNYIESLDRKTVNNNILYKYISQDIEDWVDFETRLGLFTFPRESNEKKNLIKQAKGLSNDNNYIENEVDTEISAEKLLSALTDFRKDFRKYLTLESKRLSDYDTGVSEVLLNGLVNFANDYDDNEKINIYSIMNSHVRRYSDSKKMNILPIDYSFLTFNYTEFLEIGKKGINVEELNKKITQIFANENYNSFKITAKIEQIYHVHSKLSGGMFLGVDNKQQLDSKRFNNKQLTSLIKPLSNEKFNNNITEIADKELFSSNIIVIYGTALGITDLTWWKKIITFLKKNHSNIILIHKFDLEVNIEEDDFFTLADIKEDTKDHLLSFDETLLSEEITDLKNRIFVNLNSPNIFKSSRLKRVINSNEKNEKYNRTITHNNIIK